MTTLKISSSHFSHENFIPKRFSCQGDDINPSLKIEGVPDGTKSLVLIVDDPDAPVGIWDHWIVWNIDPTVSVIEDDSIPKGGVEGKNSWGRNNYGGPCPPSGTHRYFFKLFALDTKLDLLKTSDKKAVEKAMQSHILEKTELMGKYKK